MVNFDLCDKHGVSDAETEMSLLANCPLRRGAGKKAVFAGCLS